MNEGISNIENELIVLQSIFADELVELIDTEPVWKTMLPRKKFMIHLNSLSGSLSSTFVELIVTIPRDYPLTKPIIEVAKTSLGLSVQPLLSELNRLADKLLGSNMLMDLIDAAQNYLEKGDARATSVYDEMIHRKILPTLPQTKGISALSFSLQQQHQVQNNYSKTISEPVNYIPIKQDSIKDFASPGFGHQYLASTKPTTLMQDDKKVMNERENSLLSQMIEQSVLDAINKKATYKASTTAYLSTSASNTNMNTISNTHNSPNLGNKYDTNTLPSIEKLFVLSASIHHSVCYVGLHHPHNATATSTPINTTTPVDKLAVYEEFVLYYNNNNHLSKLVDTISSVSHAQASIDFPSLYTIDEFEYMIRMTQIKLRFRYKFFPSASTLSELLELGYIFDLNMLRKFASSLISGLHTLHANNITHGNIIPDNVLIFNGAAVFFRVSVARIITDYIHTLNSTSASDISEEDWHRYWPCPELLTETGYVLKSDIWFLGCLLIEVYLGKKPTTHHKSENIDLFINQLPTDLQDFLAVMLCRTPRDRWSAERLLQHPFLSTKASSSSLSLSINNYNNTCNSIQNSFTASNFINNKLGNTARTPTNGSFLNDNMRKLSLERTPILQLQQQNHQQNFNTVPSNFPNTPVYKLDNISVNRQNEPVFYSLLPGQHHGSPVANQRMTSDNSRSSISQEPHKLSRFKHDFEELKFLGKGGFGDVIQVRNRLDGRLYAVKRIRLGPSGNANNKIKREVSLLSQLHHIQIVRYYQAWIESHYPEDFQEKKRSNKKSKKQLVTILQSPGSNHSNNKDQDIYDERYDEDEDTDEIESHKLDSLQINDNNSYSSGSSGFLSDDSNVSGLFEFDLDYSHSGNWAYRKPMNPGKKLYSDKDIIDNAMENIIFASSSSNFSQSSDDLDTETDTNSNSSNSTICLISSNTYSTLSGEGNTIDFIDSSNSDQLLPPLVNTPINYSTAIKREPNLSVLYIQMEYCENTLTSLIDSHVVQENKDLRWKIYHQLMEGLEYIHKKGIIHRDLKPSNVFLDCDNNVKLGDFGLATAESISSEFELDPTISNASTSDILGMASASTLTKAKMYVLGGNSNDGLAGKRNTGFMNNGSESMTGNVGTALYVSPELQNAKKGIKYSEKVDIYSMGIILFEMSHVMSTGMERVNSIKAIRKPTVEFPPSFDTSLYAAEHHMITLMLNHDPKQRPSATALLNDKYMPPKLEASFIQEIQRTLSNPETPHYNLLMDALFSQKTEKHRDFAYDYHLYSNPTPVPVTQQFSYEVTQSNEFSSEELEVKNYINMELCRIFGKHGAVYMATPLLMPYTPQMSENSVVAMDRSGFLVALPYNLTLPFARYVARKHIKCLKRFNISPVYKDMTPTTGAPKELMEIDFDIIGTYTKSLLPDAEAIKVVHEVVYDVLKLNPPLTNTSSNNNSSSAYNKTTIKINHYLLLDASLVGIGIPLSKKKDAVRILTKLTRFNEQSIAELVLYIDSVIPVAEQDATTSDLPIINLMSSTNIETLALQSALANSSPSTNPSAKIKKKLELLLDNSIDLDLSQVRRLILLYRIKGALTEVKSGLISIIDHSCHLYYVLFNWATLISGPTPLSAIISNESPFHEHLNIRHLISAIEQLETLKTYLSVFKVTAKVIVDISLFPQNHQAGCMFQYGIELDNGRFDILASGGRYDNLVAEYRLPNDISEPVFAVGVTIAFEKLYSILINEHKRMKRTKKDTEPFLPPFKTALICSSSTELAVQKINVATLLLKYNVNIDILYSPLISIDECMAQCKRNRIPFLVIVKENSNVKLKNIQTREDFDFSVQELLTYIVHGAHSLNSQVNSTANSMCVSGISSGNYATIQTLPKAHSTAIFNNLSTITHSAPESQMRSNNNYNQIHTSITSSVSPNIMSNNHALPTAAQLIPPQLSGKMPYPVIMSSDKDQRINSFEKKKIFNRVAKNPKLMRFFDSIVTNQKIEIIAIDLDKEVLQGLVQQLDLNDKTCIDEIIKTTLPTSLSRSNYKKYILSIIEQLIDLHKANQLFIFASYTDDSVHFYLPD